MKSTLILGTEETEKKVVKLIKLMNNDIDAIKTLFDVLNQKIELLKNIVFKYNLTELFEILCNNSMIEQNNDNAKLCIYYENIEIYEKFKSINLSKKRQFDHAISYNSLTFINYFINKFSPDELCFTSLLEMITTKIDMNCIMSYLNKMKINTNDVNLLNKIIGLKNLTVVEKLLSVGFDIDMDTIYKAYKTKDKLLFETILKYANGKNLNKMMIDVKNNIIGTTDCDLMYLFDLYIK